MLLFKKKSRTPKATYSSRDNNLTSLTKPQDISSTPVKTPGEPIYYEDFANGSGGIQMFFYLLLLILSGLKQIEPTNRKNKDSSKNVK